MPKEELYLSIELHFLLPQILLLIDLFLESKTLAHNLNDSKLDEYFSDTLIFFVMRSLIILQC